MSNKQKINDAFANIDEALIESVARAPKERRRLERITAIAVCVAILLSFALGAFLMMRLTDRGDVSSNGWVVITSDKTSVKKQKKGLSGLQYTLCISYTPLQAMHSDLLGIEPERDVCAEMLGQWLLSAATFDYSQHFPLFAEEILNERIYPVFEAEGYDTQGAYEKIATVVADTVGFTHCRVEYSVKNVQNTEETLGSFCHLWAEYFDEIGINVQDITQVCEYTIEEIKIYYNDLFLIEFSLPTIAFYQIDGVWYASPEMLDDDISIDLIQATPGEKNGYYEARRAQGVVDRIENGYVVLMDTQYYLLTSDNMDISVGDYVEITYHSVGGRGLRVSDGVWCDFGAIASINVGEQPYLQDATN